VRVEHVFGFMEQSMNGLAFKSGELKRRWKNYYSKKEEKAIEEVY